MKIFCAYLLFFIDLKGRITNSVKAAMMGKYLGPVVILIICSVVITESHPIVLKWFVGTKKIIFIIYTQFYFG